MRESNASKRTVAQRVARRRLSVAPEKEAWLRINKGVAESIYDDSRYVAFASKPESANISVIAPASGVRSRRTEWKEFRRVRVALALEPAFLAW